MAVRRSGAAAFAGARPADQVRWGRPGQLGCRWARRSRLGPPGRPRESLDAHRKVVDAIRGGDASAAGAAMAAHIEAVSDVALLRDE